MKKQNTLKITVAVLLVIVSAAVIFSYSTQAVYLLCAVSAKSAVRYIPSLPFSFDGMNNAPADTKATSLTTAEEEETTTEKTIAETTAETTEETAETTSAVKKISKNKPAEKEEFFVLPEDIKKLIKAQTEKSSNEEKVGNIREKKYTSEGVTDKEGAVKVKNTNNTKINVKELLGESLSFSVNKEEPAVLIFHTHTTESYQYIDRNFYSSSYAARSVKNDRNMVRIGEAVKSEIEKQGFKVIHDTTVHDTKYSGAYGRSRKTVEEYLKKYPSIQIVLDVHRDGIADYDGTKIKPTAVINGKKVAQVMIISGCQEKENGITGYENWKENLVFALKLQKEMEETFPGLTRPVFFCGRKYNMDMTKASLLLEVGSDSNTIEEAYYSALCIGKAVSQILEKVME